MTNTALDPRLGLPVAHLVDDGGVVRGALRRRRAELTEGEAEVMRLVIAGRPDKLLADLCINVRTVEVHRARVFDEINAKSAVARAKLLRHAGAGAREGSDGR